jgi:TetR/AcrR family transcriptional regulator, acrAB operon repressor
MKKTAAEAAQTRQAILDAALKVFSAQGYSATTLDEVARSAGVTRGAVYWHFAGKAQLYQALLRAYSNRSLPIIQQAAQEGGSFLEVCKRILTRLLASLESDAELRAVTELLLFKTAQSSELTEVRRERVESARELTAMMASIMQQGIASGALRADADPFDLARAFLAYQEGLFYVWLADPAGFSLSERASALADLFITGIKA